MILKLILVKKINKIAIIGSSSFLASYIIKEFEKSDSRLLLLSRTIGDYDCDFIEFNYPNNIPELDFFLNFDIIIYTAAAGVQSNINYLSEEIYSLNAFYPIQLISFLIQNNYPGKIVTFGSYFEIGANSISKYFDENELVFSQNIINNDYCISKRLFSRFSFDNLGRLKHFHIILPSVYGAKENKNRLIPFVVESLKMGRKIELTAGTQIRQFLHAKDVTSFLSNCFNEEVEPGIYNLASNSAIMVKDLVEVIFSMFNKDSSDALGKINKRDESMQILMLNDLKARNTKWTPKVSLLDGVNEYLN